MFRPALTFVTALILCRRSSRQLLPHARRELPHWTHYRGMHLARKIDHARKSRQGFFALVIVVAESHAEFVGDRPLLHAADEQIDVLLLEKSREFQRIRIVDDNRAFVAQFAQLLVIFAAAGLRT